MENNIIQLENNIRSNLKKINNYQQLEKLKNYYYNEYTGNYKKTGDSDFANYLNKNLDKCTDEELKYLCLKYIDSKKAKSILLLYELENYKEEQEEMELVDFIKYTKQIFRRYQGKASGFLIEDTEWKIYTETTNEYNLKENEILLENSINKLDIDNHDTIKFLNLIENRLQQKTSNIDVDIRINNNDGKDTAFILIWLNDKTKN